jgi:hypothetical protein
MILEIHMKQKKINYNSFGSLSNEVECYKCNNFGYMTKDYRLIVPPREPKKNIKHEPQIIWRRKHDQFNTKECFLVLQVQHKKSGRYVDSSCSNHMIGYNNMILTLKKEQYGSISFGNDNLAIIIGRDIVKLGSKEIKHSIGQRYEEQSSKCKSNV